jgi:GntR family transcriptional regulator
VVREQRGTSARKLSELTVHGAVKELQYEGVLESSAGRGAFVKAMPERASDGPDLIAVTELRAEVANLRERVAALECLPKRG